MRRSSASSFSASRRISASTRSLAAAPTMPSRRSLAACSFSATLARSRRQTRTLSSTKRSSCPMACSKCFCSACLDLLLIDERGLVHHIGEQLRIRRHVHRRTVPRPQPRETAGDCRIERGAVQDGRRNQTLHRLEPAVIHARDAPAHRTARPAPRARRRRPGPTRTRASLRPTTSRARWPRRPADARRFSGCASSTPRRSPVANRRLSPTSTPRSNPSSSSKMNRPSFSERVNLPGRDAR